MEWETGLNNQRLNRMIQMRKVQRMGRRSRWLDPMKQYGVSTVVRERLKRTHDSSPSPQRLRNQVRWWVTDLLWRIQPHLAGTQTSSYAQTGRNGLAKTFQQQTPPEPMWNGIMLTTNRIEAQWSFCVSKLKLHSDRADRPGIWESFMRSRFLNGLRPELSTAVKQSCIGWEKARLDTVRDYAIHAEK